MIIVRALYGQKSSVAALGILLDEKLHEFGYRPSIADPDVWMRPVVKSGGFMYHNYLLFYVNKAPCIIDKLLCNIKSIQSKFK